MAATFTDLIKYLDILDNEKPNNLDEMIDLTGLDEETCRSVHDFIYKIAERVIKRSTFTRMVELNDQISLVDSLVVSMREQLGEIENVSAMKDTRSQILSAIKSAVSLRETCDKILNRAFDREVVEEVLNVLFSVLSESDPVIAVRVRDECVRRMKETVLSVPTIPGRRMNEAS